MPSWAVNEDIWKQAKDAVKRSRDKSESEFNDRDWGLVTHIYKNLGGKVKKRKKSTIFIKKLKVSGEK